jgi:hypothetical protein
LGAKVARASRPADAQDLQQKLAAAKEAAARNQQMLRSYSWMEKTELRLKGEVKATKVDSCRYRPDGEVQKTAVFEPPPQKRRGLKGKIVAKKTGEMKEELENAKPGRSEQEPLRAASRLRTRAIFSGIPEGPGGVSRHDVAVAGGTLAPVRAPMDSAPVVSLPPGQSSRRQ